MKKSISFICSDNFMQEVINEIRPLLVLYMTMDENYNDQLELIEKMSKDYSGLLKFGLLEEAFLSAFKKLYKVAGSPTFLILSEGRERNRFLGLADEQTLTDFVVNSCILDEKLL